MQKAIEAAGGITELARRVGVTRQRVQYWVDRHCPAEHCLKVETATDGLVSRYELRPDVYGEANQKDAA